MLITLDNTEWTALSGLDEGSTYALQIVNPSSALIKYAAETPEDDLDAIKLSGNDILKFDYNGSNVIKAEQGLFGSVQVTIQEV